MTLAEQAERMAERFQEAGSKEFRPLITPIECNEAAALLRQCAEALRKDQGECICPKCGIRHGGSNFTPGDF